MNTGADAAPSRSRDELEVAGPGEPPIFILCLGDSYTVGEGVEPGRSWPDLLVRRLRQEGLQISVPRILARSGWTGAELEAALQTAEERGDLGGPFALVTLLVGVNDQFRGGRAADIAQTLDRLLERALALAGGDAARVLVISLPDWGVTPFAHDRDWKAIGREIDAFNAVIQGRASHRGAGWVDITALTRRLGAVPDFVTEDGLHLTGAAYAEWVEVLLPAVLPILRGDR